MEDDLVLLFSPTLADLYLEQGYVEKAIEIYEHLCKKEGEKEIYARRLEYLKKYAGKRASTIRDLMKRIW